MEIFNHFRSRLILFSLSFETFLLDTITPNNDYNCNRNKTGPFWFDFSEVVAEVAVATDVDAALPLVFGVFIGFSSPICTRSWYSRVDLSQYRLPQNSQTNFPWFLLNINIYNVIYVYVLHGLWGGVRYTKWPKMRLVQSVI